MSKFYIRGLEDVLASLKSLEAKVGKKMLRSAMRKGLRPVLAKTKEECPVDTGALKAAVKIRAGKRKKGVIRLNVQVSDVAWQGKTWYGAAVEFGHKDPISGKMIPPNPFMRRAFDATQDQCTAIVKAELQAALANWKNK